MNLSDDGMISFQDLLVHEIAYLFTKESIIVSKWSRYKTKEECQKILNYQPETLNQNLSAFRTLTVTDFCATVRCVTKIQETPTLLK